MSRAIDIRAEIKALQESIEYVAACLEAAEMIGSTGGEDFLVHLSEADNGPATLSSAARVQEAAEDMQAELRHLLDLLAGQLQTKEASRDGGAMSKAGFYLAVEGGEGAGKSTQVKLLAEAFEQRGIHVVQTREPGATVLGREIRELLVRRGGDRPGRRAEALLYAADRAHHIEKIVYPALLDGQVVIQDRSVGSSLAYQSGAGGLDHDKVLGLSAWGTDGILPHMTIYLDIDPVEGLRRASARGETNRFEDESIEYHRRVRDSFRWQAQAHNWFLINASRSIEKVHQQVLDLALMQAVLFGHEPGELEKQ